MAVALLVACSGSDSSTAEKVDAAVPDKTRVDGGADGQVPLDQAAGRDDASEPDASFSDDAELSADASARVVSWRDVPEGRAAAPREVCSRRWELATRGEGLLMVSDAAGHLLVAGTLSAEQDFGDGALKPPLGEPARLTTFVLKLDAACNVVWSRAFAPTDDMMERRPLSLGVDEDRRITLLTESGRYMQIGLDRYYQETKLDLSLLAEDGSEAIQKTIVAKNGEPMTGSLQTNWHGITLVSSATNRGGPYNFGAGVADARRGGMINALLRSDGSLVHSQIYGDVGAFSGPLQRLGPNGEIYAVGHLVSLYYGQKLDGTVTLMKLDASAKLVWKKELHPRVDVPYSVSQIGVADDGAFVLYDSYAPGLEDVPTSSLRELTADGDSVWDMPVVESERAGFLPWFMRTRASSVAAYGSLNGTVQLGHTTLESPYTGDQARGQFVAQLERGGATRWALAMANTQYVVAIDTTPSDEVAVLSNEGTSLIVTKLGR